MPNRGDTYARDLGSACGLLEATFIELTKDGTDVRLRLEDGKMITMSCDELSKDWQLVQGKLSK